MLYKHGLYALGAKLREPDDIATLADQHVTVFAAERSSEADHVRRAPFTPPPTFKLADVVHGAFGIHVGETGERHDVAIEFSKERATYARSRLWHPTQQLVEQPDGNLFLRFQTSSLLPVVSWVLEWGPHARAREPAALVQAVVEELDAARQRYR